MNEAMECDTCGSILWSVENVGYVCAVCSLSPDDSVRSKALVGGDSSSEREAVEDVARDDKDDRAENSTEFHDRSISATLEDSRRKDLHVLIEDVRDSFGVIKDDLRNGNIESVERNVVWAEKRFAELEACLEASGASASSNDPS